MHKHTPDRPPIVGIAWFDRKQWLRLTDAVADRSEFDDTYETWQRRARDALQMIEHQGHTIEMVHVEVESLMFWCNERRLSMNGKSCAEYVSELARRRHGQL